MSSKQAGSWDLDRIVKALRTRIELLLARQASNPSQRLLVALAGVPGAGKTAVTSALLRDLSTREIDGVVVVPMDGFHYTKATLSTFSDPALAFRKRGAPWTFDVAGLLSLIEALKTTPIMDSGSRQHPVAAPSFDHATQDPVQDDIHIPSSSRIAIIEGNYTLLDEVPWSNIANMVDERWLVDVPSLEVAKERLVQRHLVAGIETSREAASLRVEDNDLPNGELVKTKLVKPDVVVVN